MSQEGYGINDGFDLTYCYVYWGTRSSPNQIPTALLATALILWLDYHSTGKIPNLDGSLVVTVNPLHVPTHNGAQYKVYTKKMNKYTTKHCLIARSGLSGNTQAWYYTSTCSP